jgi:hypothetical protein
MGKKKYYKCTYTSEEGAMCPVMGNYNEAHPSHCFAYDCEIWDINPKKICKNCIQLANGEKPEKKIWCNEMYNCDSYHDGGKSKCIKCPAGTIVFDPERDVSGIHKCLVKEACPRKDGLCTDDCHLCLFVTLSNEETIDICIAARHEITPNKEYGE